MKSMKRVSMALLVAGVAVLNVAALAHATPPGQDGEHKATICHRTNSATNPYVQIEVDLDSIDGDEGNDNGQGDHFLEHTGPLASSEAVAQALKDAKTEWGDIIPPLEGIHGGLNWTAEGQAMFANGCNFTTVSTPTPTPTPTPTTTPTDEPTLEPPGEGGGDCPADDCAPPKKLAKTGADLGLVALAGDMLLGLGLGLRAIGRRRATA